MTADQPAVDRGSERILGRMVDAGVDEPSIGRFRVLSAPLTLPGTMDRIVGDLPEPPVPPAIARIARPERFFWTGDERPLAPNGIPADIAGHNLGILLVFD